MKGQEFPVKKTADMGIFLLVAIIVVVIIAIMIPRALGGINDSKQYSIEQEKTKQLEDLNDFYDTFKKTDGGFDSYEASVLLAKAIEYTWKDCANFCDKTMDITDFTNFFLTHPITLSKTLDCETAYVYDKDTEHKISKDRISEYCKKDDIGADKTGTVDEWTTTIWGLYRNSIMCTNYIADGEQWGNFNCGSAETPNIKCKPWCGIGVDKTPPERTQDRIQKWEGIMKVGETYNNIRVIYSPDCTLILGYLPYSDIACIKVEIGAGTEVPISGGDAGGTGGGNSGGSGSGSQCPAVNNIGGYTCTDSSTCSKFGGCVASGTCPRKGEICCKEPPC